MGRPSGAGFQTVVDDLNLQFKELALELRPVVKPDRRGRHTAVTLGISYGGGQRQPGNLKVPPRSAQACIKVMNSSSMSRLVGFIDSM